MNSEELKDGVTKLKELHADLLNQMPKGPILVSRPDYGKLTDGYLKEIAEAFCSRVPENTFRIQIRSSNHVPANEAWFCDHNNIPFKKVKIWKS